jgi:hypothetical protein
MNVTMIKSSYVEILLWIHVLTHPILCSWSIVRHTSRFQLAQNSLECHSVAVSSQHTQYVSTPPYHLQYLLHSGPHMASPDLCPVLLTTGPASHSLSVQPISILISSMSVQLQLWFWREGSLYWNFYSKDFERGGHPRCRSWVSVCVSFLPICCITNDFGIRQRQKLWLWI